MPTALQTLKEAREVRADITDLMRRFRSVGRRSEQVQREAKALKQRQYGAFRTTKGGQR